MYGLLAGALILPLDAARADRDDMSKLSAYAQARAAASFGAPQEAAKRYATLLAASPDNVLLAQRAFGQALAAGDKELALTAAHILDRAGDAKTDVALFLLTDALRAADWQRAETYLARIEKDEVFGFIAPIARAWVAADTGKGDPFALLAGAETGPAGKSYAAEHRPLLLLATGHHQQGAGELLKLTQTGGMRGQRLRIGGAALLADKGQREAALGLLQGEEPAIVAARRLLEEGKPLPGRIASAEQGVAELLLRIAVDLHRQEVPALGLTFARMATMLAPDSSEGWLVTSELLTAENHPRAALDALAHIDPADPFAPVMRDARIQLLADAKDEEAALKLAQEATDGGDATAAEWTRLGDLYTALERWPEAADAYGQALAVAEEVGTARWALHLLRGAAFEQAGQWGKGKAELEAAYKLAPDQAVVLNYLGYAQLERRENVDEAMRLIAEASKLEPDSPEITDSLGWAHFLQGNLPRAIELLEKAVVGQPADPEINEHLGDAYYKAGRHYEARYAWNAALVYAEDEDAARIRAKIETGLTPALVSP